jgi:hypothetical protein
MLVLCWVLAIIYLVLGVFTLVGPNLVRRWSLWFDEPLRIRLSAFVGIALGVIFLFGRRATHERVFVGTVGLLLLFTSLFYLFAPWHTIRLVDRLPISASDTVYRMYGVISILIAIGFLFAAGV